MPVQCLSAVETEGLENRCLINFPSVGKRNVGAIEHYYRGDVWLKPLSVHEEEWDLLLAFGAWGLEQLRHLWMFVAATHWILREGKPHTSPTTETFPLTGSMM